MAELVLDVHLEVDPLQLAAVADPARAVAELSRQQAEVQAHAAGATLRHPDPRDVHVRHAIVPLTGSTVLLVASRWICDGPTQP